MKLFFAIFAIMFPTTLLSSEGFVFALANGTFSALLVAFIYEWARPTCLPVVKPSEGTMHLQLDGTTLREVPIHDTDE